MNKKRKLTAIIAMILCLGLLGGCAKKEEELDAQIASSFAEITEQNVQELAQYSEADIAYQIEEFENSGNTTMATAWENWLSAKEEVGALTAVDAKNAQVEFKNNQYTVTLNAAFEKRPMEVTMIYDKSGITNMEFSPVYTLRENMSRALTHTLIGMGTVFIVLIFISLVIGCFKYINEWEKKAKAKEVPAPAPAAPAPALAPVVQEVPEVPAKEVTDDLELVAVITAAIAASLDTPADGLVVRSIKRKSGAKWKRA